MTTPSIRSKGGKTPLSGGAGRSTPDGVNSITVEVKLEGTAATVAADIATLVGASYTAGAVNITFR